nr:hypothetical protein [Tanacetum cinerariifolium]
MDTTIDQQVAMDEALVPHAKRLRIGRSNFRLLSDIKSKKSTLQLVYDVLLLCPFFKAFLVTADVFEIYMQEFWATATVHHHVIRFKMDNKKHIVNLESAAIRKLTDVNINKLYQPWRSFAAIINKCLTGKGSGYDSLRLSQAQILWGLYHKRNVDHAYLTWEDFVYQVEHKDYKKSNEMYYPRFTKVIIHHIMSKDPSIPRRNKFGALLPIELTNEEIRNSNAYKEYYVVATGTAPPKPKASVRKTRSSSDTTITPPTAAAGPRLTTSEKGKQTAKASKAKSTDEGIGSIPGVPDIPTDEPEEKLSWNSTDEEGDDDEDDDGEEGHDDDDDDDQEVKMDDEKDDEEEGGDDEQEYDKEEYDEETRDEESFDPISKTPKKSNDEGNGEEDLGLNVGREEGHNEEKEKDELYRDINMNQGRGMESIFETTSQMDVQTPTSVASLPMTAPTMTPSTIATITTTSQAPITPTTTPVKVAVKIQSDRLRDEAQKENDEFLKTVDENMHKIIKEQVKEQVKVQVSKILPRLEQTVNEQLEAEVLTRSSHSSKTSNLYKALVKAYESDKIILDTYGETVTLKRRRDDDADKDEEPFAGPDRGSKRCREGKKPESASAPKEKATRSAGKSIQGSKYRQVSASESALAEEPMETTFQMEESSHPEFDTGLEDQPIVQSSQHPECIQPWISELVKQTDSRSPFNELMDTPLDFSNFLINRLKVNTLTPKLLAGPTYELMKGSCKSLVELEYHLEEVFKATTDQLDWVNPEGQQYPHNLLKPLPLIPNNRGRRVISFEHFINNDLEYLRGRASSRKYTTSVKKTKAADYGHIKWIEDLVPRTMWIEEPIGHDTHALWGVSHWGRKRLQFYNFAVNRESARDVYSKRRIIAVTELKIEGDFKRLRIQDIKDILLLLVQGKLTNLTVEERFAFNVFLRMFTRSIVNQRRVEDLQLGVESYQKKLNLTKPDMDRSDLKRKEAYTAYFNPRGFIYQNKDKKNRLIQIDELHKFSDGMLIDVRTALYDRLKGIRMKYLPQSIWRKSDKDRAAAMIQAIDKRLKTRRITRSLERFVRGRLYEGDFGMLQRTI